jgi:GTP-binding protein
LRPKLRPGPFRLLWPPERASLPHPLPIVAIVGRPNVGKSTLFNRYAGHRRALVVNTPGITRDRIAEEVEVGERRILLVDTAGLDPEAEGEMEGAVQRQAMEALEGADAVLLVVDGQVGLVPQEEELANILRRSDRPVAVGVNKIDVPGHAPRVLEFHALGLELVRGISAEHASGAWDLLEELVAALPEAPAEEPRKAGEGAPCRVALVGRPNVGKSSLLNRLVGETRVVVSSTPGTTRDAIDIEVERGDQRFVFVDTAGLRRPGRRDERVERGSALMTVRAIERADVGLILVDADEGFTDQDARVISLVRERGRAAAVLVNKWDLLAEAPDRVRRLEDELARRLRPMADVPVLRLSAKTGKGTGRIFPTALQLEAASSLQISTAELNRWLKESTARHEPAMATRGARRRPLKFFYATQVASRPPTFVLFCTDPTAIQTSYMRFLENQLRERFKLAGVPIRLRLRRRRPEDA